MPRRWLERSIARWGRLQEVDRALRSSIAPAARRWIERSAARYRRLSIARRSARSTWLHQWRRSWRPRIFPVCLNGLAISRKYFAKSNQVERVALRAKRRQIFFRESKQAHRWGEAFAVFRMVRMLELLLQMDERSRRLDQALKVLRVLGCDRVVQPNLLQNIVGFVVSLLVPAFKKCAIIGMRSDAVTGCIRFLGPQ